MTTIGDVYKWLEMDAPTSAALELALGSPKYLESWARIPEKRYHEECANMRVPAAENEEEGEAEEKFRCLTAVEEGQVRAVRGLVIKSLLNLTAVVRAVEESRREGGEGLRSGS